MKLLKPITIIFPHISGAPADMGASAERRAAHLQPAAAQLRPGVATVRPYYYQRHVGGVHGALRACGRLQAEQRGFRGQLPNARWVQGIHSSHGTGVLVYIDSVHACSHGINLQQNNSKVAFRALCCKVGGDIKSIKLYNE